MATLLDEHDLTRRRLRDDAHAARMFDDLDLARAFAADALDLVDA